MHHIQASDIEGICQLQGSKYTQSDTEFTFQSVKEAMNQGREVLYSSTACQIAGLYGFVGSCDENLITIDIVCHGVPSNRMFQDYINIIEEQKGGKVVQFTFRDKRPGWGTNGRVKIDMGDKSKQVTVWSSDSSYLYYFSQG